MEGIKVVLLLKDILNMPVSILKTFAPVIRIEIVRILLAFALFCGLKVRHIDAKTAFLNSPADFEIYIEQPEGFICEQFPDFVLLLNKSLYGLKQAPRLWYLLLCSIIISLGFIPLESDPCIYFSPECSIIIAVYVDDILIFAPTDDACIQVFQQLATHFQMSDLGRPSRFLGLEFHWNANGSLSLNQAHYIDHLLKRFQMEDAHPAKTPLDHSLPLLLARPEDQLADVMLYQELIGSLNHLAVFSRPDIANSVSQLSAFRQNPTEMHMKAARRVYAI